mmetsp:Transcript_1785/g.3434  ORF Transcript_1785/g.3434 Transcript_1785/m.3434 type:complete len:243 (-) Transcript_1785:131-859(-)
MPRCMVVRPEFFSFLLNSLTQSLLILWFPFHFSREHIFGLCSLHLVHTFFRAAVVGRGRGTRDTDALLYCLLLLFVRVPSRRQRCPTKRRLAFLLYWLGYQVSVIILRESKVAISDHQPTVTLSHSGTSEDAAALFAYGIGGSYRVAHTRFSSPMPICSDTGNTSRWWRAWELTRWGAGRGECACFAEDGRLALGKRGKPFKVFLILLPLVFPGVNPGLFGRQCDCYPVPRSFFLLFLFGNI